MVDLYYRQHMVNCIHSNTIEDSGVKLLDNLVYMIHHYLLHDFVLRHCQLTLSTEISVHPIVLHTSGSDLGSLLITNANTSRSFSELPYFHILLLHCDHLSASLLTTGLTVFYLLALPLLASDPQKPL